MAPQQAGAGPMNGPTVTLPQSGEVVMPSGSKTENTSKPKRSWAAPKREDLLTERQLAADLGLSLRTLRRHFEKRTGPKRITLGKHILYRRCTVDEWLAARDSFAREPVLPRQRHRATLKNR